MSRKWSITEKNESYLGKASHHFVHDFKEAGYITGQASDGCWITPVTLFVQSFDVFYVDRYDH